MHLQLEWKCTLCVRKCGYQFKYLSFWFDWGPVTWLHFFSFFFFPFFLIDFLFHDQIKWCTVAFWGRLWLKFPLCLLCITKLLLLVCCALQNYCYSLASCSSSCDYSKMVNSTQYRYILFVTIRPPWFYSHMWSSLYNTSRPFIPLTTSLEAAVTVLDKSSYSFT